MELGANGVAIRGDSELVIKQLTKECKCLKENLLMSFVKTNALLGKIDDVSFKHIPKMCNQEANDLAQIASGYKVSKSKLKELIKIKEKTISTHPLPFKLSRQNWWG